MLIPYFESNPQQLSHHNTMNNQWGDFFEQWITPFSNQCWYQKHCHSPTTKNKNG